ncbi:hypothetical protein ANCCEY_06598 [Ancylostoma ceylanicum]|uniref:Uncharacterized protein n=1 Tax=Ancylostoma ceylanicum TaxID=53326 RepID=A0A0D6LQL2_9BILA|nr:hypothetical protein ANCCEY_06598 [Ancylostoma ceylanicum]
MTYWWRSVLLVNVVVTSVLADVCVSRHFHDIRGNEIDDYIIYGLTQDCQIFFIRPSQIPLLSTINVNVHNSYCYPNLVQLHLKSHNSLLLVTKQAGNRICTLDVQIPPTEMLFGDHDVIYFIDAQSTGALWSVHQFQINSDGFLKHLEKISVNNHAKQVWTGPDLASEYVVALDNQRNYIYIRNRFERSLLFECAYDLLFSYSLLSSLPYASCSHSSPQMFQLEPDLSFLDTVFNDVIYFIDAQSTGALWSVHQFQINSDGFLKHLEKISVNNHAKRTVSPAVTRLFGLNTGDEKPGSCLVYTNYAFDVGIMQQATLKKMETNPLPAFEKSKRMSTTRTTTSTAASTTTKASRTNTRRPKPSTRRLLTTTTTTTPKMTTIYSTSTEKIVTSTEFRRGTEDADDDDVDEITLRERTTVRVLETSTSFEEERNIIEAQEKSKILERDNEGIGLMTTLHSEEDLEPIPSSNTSSAKADLKNPNAEQGRRPE